jgi:hypothetical protein
MQLSHPTKIETHEVVSLAKYILLKHLLSTFSSKLTVYLIIHETIVYQFETMHTHIYLLPNVSILDRYLEVVV